MRSALMLNHVTCPSDHLYKCTYPRLMNAQKQALEEWEALVRGGI